MRISVLQRRERAYVTMLIFIAILLIFTQDSRLSAAEINSDVVTPPLANPLENLKDTQKYIEARDVHNDNLDSYVFAYNNGKDILEKAAELTQIKRIKRTPTELIKFELSDAKEPDEMTKALLQQSRQQRMLEFETLKLKPKIDTSKQLKSSNVPLSRKSGDQTPAESNVIRVFAPNRMELKSMEKIPTGVRKIIEHMFLQKRSLYNGQPAKRYAAGLENAKVLYQGYGDLPYKLDNAFYNKAVNLDFANQIPYIPALFPGQHRQPSPDHMAQVQAYAFQNQPQNLQGKSTPQLKFVHFAKPVFAPAPRKLEQPAPKQEVHFQNQTPEPQPQLQPHNSVNINLPLGGKKIEINFDDEYEKQSIHEVTHFHENEEKYRISSNTDKMTKVLKDLITKTPTEQLQGLSLLLSNKQNVMQEQAAPEKNTAPILFPPVNQHTPKPEVNFNSVSHSPEPQREFTPITEQQLDDVTPAPNVQYIPVKVPYISSPQLTIEEPEVQHSPQQAVFYKDASERPESYKEAHMGDLSPNYEGLEDYHHDKEFEYASKYNFGYRIRDFHTGNDFGHTEKRDSDGVTRGQYHILLPDGRIQNVEYHVDDTGYHADVTYESIH